MYECFRCMEKSVEWVHDFPSEEVSGEEDGIVSILICTNDKCKSEIHVKTFYKEN